jgi:hypothetical protein
MDVKTITNKVIICLNDQELHDVLVSEGFDAEPLPSGTQVEYWWPDGSGLIIKLPYRQPSTYRRKED